jgi:electron transfer flavoprotein alpha subunit
MSREIWSFLESEGEKFHDTAYKMAAEARRTADIFDADPCAVIFGTYNSKLPEQLSWYGLKKIYLFETNAPLSPETIGRSLHDTAGSVTPQFMLFAHTPHGAEVAARVAASLKRGLITHCVDFGSEGGKPVARKPAYGGKADAHIAWMTPPPYLATIDSSSLEEVRAKTKTDPAIIREEIKRAICRTRLINEWKVGLAEIDFSEASIVIGVGKGVCPKFITTINKLADLIKGVTGGTRIAVYSGLIPLERQIGTTGKWIDSDVYIAIGISGAPQHVMGTKEAKNIIAINISREAPIFRYATLGIVCDLHEVIPCLITLIEKHLYARS